MGAVIRREKCNFGNQNTLVNWGSQSTARVGTVALGDLENARALKLGEQSIGSAYRGGILQKSLY